MRWWREWRRNRGEGFAGEELAKLRERIMVLNPPDRAALEGFAAQYRETLRRYGDACGLAMLLVSREWAMERSRAGACGRRELPTDRHTEMKDDG